jgi:hypothetical protein
MTEITDSNKDCLYIGPYRDISPTGRNSLSVLKHLSKQKLNVCSRPIFHGHKQILSPMEDIGSESIKVGKKDVLIQYDYIDSNNCRLVNNKDYNKKIAMVEISDIDISPIIKRSLDCMDAVVVFSSLDYMKVRSSGYLGKVIDFSGTHCIDLEKTNRIDEQFILDRSAVNKNILFTIIPNIYAFEYNFIDLLVCFFNSYKKTDNTILVIATGNETKEVKDNVAKIKKSMPNDRSLPNVGIINIKDYKKGLEICSRYIDASCDFRLREEHALCILNKIPMLTPNRHTRFKVSFYEYEVKRSPKLVHAQSNLKNKCDDFWYTPDTRSLIDCFKYFIKESNKEKEEEEDQFMIDLQNKFVKTQMDSMQEIINVCYE